MLAPDLSNPILAIQQLASDLRNPNGGCPWDLKQDHQSMIKNLIEESYEVVDAIENLSDNNSYENLKEELGDVLFQVIFHSQLASERNLFNFNDVAKYVTEKLVFRHPHVYGDLQGIENSEQVLHNWEKLKREEREKNKQNDKPKKMLDGLPKSMPGLLKSFRMGQKVSKVGFDWSDDKKGLDKLKDKLHEEIEELFDELTDEPQQLDESNKKRAKEELGDVFFVLAQLARKYEIDPEEASQYSNEKFKKRFSKIEEVFEDRLNNADFPSLDEWNIEWNKIKEHIH